MSSGSEVPEETSGTADAADTAKITLPSGWENHLTVKRWHFAAAAQYRKACDDLGANRYGDEPSSVKFAG